MSYIKRWLEDNIDNISDEELLESGSIEIDDTIVEFKVLEKDNDDILKSIVEVTGL